MFKQFPWRLDMEPYTVEGMARREGQQVDRSSLSDNQSSSSSNDGDGGNSDSLNGEIEAGIEAASINCESSPIQYDLVGIVVHSGQANAGHYYSFIRDRR
jgi:ubiquitin carboxyl-terminal hydrolase 9/24